MQWCGILCRIFAITQSNWHYYEFQPNVHNQSGVMEFYTQAKPLFSYRDGQCRDDGENSYSVQRKSLAFCKRTDWLSHSI